MTLQCKLLAEEYAICRLAPTEPVPKWVDISSAEFSSLTRTSEELSVVMPAAFVPQSVVCARGWRVVKLVGPFPLEAVGVIAPLLRALSQNEITVFVVSTYDTDWILVPAARLDQAIAALEGAGCELLE